MKWSQFKYTYPVESGFYWIYKEVSMELVGCLYFDKEDHIWFVEDESFAMEEDWTHWQKAKLPKSPSGL